MKNENNGEERQLNDDNDIGHGRVFLAEFDDDGVYFYQAYNDDIADWSLMNRRLGGPKFNPSRMTWIKPSFARMVYRAGYGLWKDEDHARILKVKLPHDAVSTILGQCKCGHGGGGGGGKSLGRVQWDPERELMGSGGTGKGPRRMERQRSIQIGMRGGLSEFDVNSILHRGRHGARPQGRQGTPEWVDGRHRLPGDEGSAGRAAK